MHTKVLLFSVALLSGIQIHGIQQKPTDIESLAFQRATTVVKAHPTLTKAQKTTLSRFLGAAAEQTRTFASLSLRLQLLLQFFRIQQFFMPNTSVTAQEWQNAQARMQELPKELEAAQRAAQALQAMENEFKTIEQEPYRTIVTIASEDCISCMQETIGQLIEMHKQDGKELLFTQAVDAVQKSVTSIDTLAQSLTQLINTHESNKKIDYVQAISLIQFWYQQDLAQLIGACEPIVIVALHASTVSAAVLQAYADALKA
ncbi:MAG: hypothetical protein WCE21_01905 [Candidatus Babeliales bacterium]